MSNFFKEVAQDAENIEQKYLGPDYKYYDEIKTPREMGMSSDGNMGALANDVAGIINYVELLVTGRGPASKNDGKPLGSRFFLKTGGQCIPKDNKTRKVDRYMYIDNVPDGSIPFISEGMDIRFSDFEGLIPGVLSDVDQINPMGIFKSFMQDAEPVCEEINLPVNWKNENGKWKSVPSFNETHYIPESDANEIRQRKNVREAFTGEKNKKQLLKKPKMTNMENIYLLSLSLLFLFLFYKLYVKTY